MAIIQDSRPNCLPLAARSSDEERGILIRLHDCRKVVTMTKGSFFTPKEKVQQFLKDTVMYDQEGLYLTWATDQEVLDKILPPQVKAVAPVTFAYIINIQKATFGARYTEAALGIPAICAGVQGVYWLEFLLAGPGAEMGTDLGREIIGIPKKIADDISIRRMGDKAVASATRHGVKFFEVEMDITGEYATEAALGVLGDPKPGEQMTLPGIFYRFSYEQTREGDIKVFDSRFAQMAFDITYHSFEKGTAEVTLRDSIDDPWAEVVCNQVLGAAYIKNDIDLAWSEDLCQADYEEVAPYIMNTRYDKGPLCQGEQYFC